jgi:16S rRNA (guanine527-N7)-methyltransferase
MSRTEAETGGGGETGTGDGPAGRSEATGTLLALAATWRVPCDAAQGERLVEYMDLLLTWNARINLTGARSVRELVEEHMPDAFALASRFSAPADVVDVGSGGGLPALPLAVLRPELRLTLVEPIAKKVAFLRTAVRALDVKSRVAVIAGRAEELAAQVPGRFDAGISRATFAPAEWLTFGRQLVRVGGRLFALAAPADVPPNMPPPLLYSGGRRALVEVSVLAAPRGRST